MRPRSRSAGPGRPPSRRSGLTARRSGRPARALPARPGAGACRSIAQIPCWPRRRGLSGRNAAYLGEHGTERARRHDQHDVVALRRARGTRSGSTDSEGRQASRPADSGRSHARARSSQARPRRDPTAPWGRRRARTGWRAPCPRSRRPAPRSAACRPLSSPVRGRAGPAGAPPAPAANARTARRS